MNNIYPNNPFSQYNPYFQQNQYQPVQNYQPITSQGPHMEIQRVNGKDAAYAFAIGPNSSVILADTMLPKIWIVTTDAAGYKVVTGMNVTPDEEPIRVEGNTEEKEDPIKILTDRIDKLEEKVKNYGKSDSRSSWQNKSGNANAQSNDRNGSRIEGSDGNNSTNVGE